MFTRQTPTTQLQQRQCLMQNKLLLTQNLLQEKKKIFNLKRPLRFWLFAKTVNIFSGVELRMHDTRHSMHHWLYLSSCSISLLYISSLQSFSNESVMFFVYLFIIFKVVFMTVVFLVLPDVGVFLFLIICFSSFPVYHFYLLCFIMFVNLFSFLCLSSFSPCHPQLKKQKQTQG